PQLHRDGEASAAGAEAEGEALDRAFQAAIAHEPTWRTLTLPVPAGPARESIDVRLSTGARGQPSLARTVHVQASTGRILSETGFADGSPGRRARSFLRFAHTGEYWGVVGQTVAGLVSLASVVLVWTGLALALRRLARALQRRRGSAHPAVAEPSPVAGASAPANPPRRRSRERALR
ncbi:MAG: PepSY domain-containing protein, partial [Gemmatimonadetes bacterium]|nr:PepSY domain-containing protein [Gemmatimonadota bacterium]